MKLIVGLGNPGKEYAETRHNLGFMAVDRLHADDFSSWKSECQALTARGTLDGSQCLLVKPQTFMNEAGRALQCLAGFYKLTAADILVVHDELDLPFGTVRAKTGGSSAGHHGVQSIIDSLVSPDFARVRIGMKTERAATVPAESFVLEKFSKDEQVQIPTILDTTIEKIRELVKKS